MYSTVLPDVMTVSCVPPAMDRPALETAILPSTVTFVSKSLAAWSEASAAARRSGGVAGRAETTALALWEAEAGGEGCTALHAVPRHAMRMAPPERSHP